MLPQPFRLLNAKDFSLVFQARKYASRNDICIQWRITNAPQSKIGFIASKKNFPKAVDRNRAKRLLRESFRTQLFQLRSGFDMIVLYRHAPKKEDFATLQTSIQQILSENGFLTKTHTP